MKKALLLFSLTIVFTSASAQKLTAEKLLDKLACVDTTCILQFFYTMGYQSAAQPQVIDKNFKLYNLQTKATECPIILGSLVNENIELVAVDNSFVKVEIRTCYERYKTLLAAFVKKGFAKVDENSKEITLHSKQYLSWEMVLQNEYTMHHSGLYSIRFDKINNIIRN